MNMEVETISKSCISPSSPTPTHLKTYKISLIDQFQPSLYFSTILFYQNSQEKNIISNKSQLLKQSLSETLTRFYPLAGKVKDRFSIDCDDEGICYTEAKSNIPLCQYLSQPDLMSLNKLMPKVTREYELPSGSPVALIQETAFSCGGFTIGIYVSHMVCDGTSLFLFLKDWAAATCGSATQHPFLDGESIFPQYDAFPREASPMSMLVPFSKKGKHIVKRIVFKESAIDNLKAEASLNNSNNPTRVEVVTTFLSKFLMRAFKNETGIDKPVAVTHPLNIRRKVEPPLPECSVGNFIKLVGTVFSTKEGELSELVNQLREAMKKWDKDFLEKIKNREDGFFKYCDAMKEMGDLLTSPVFANGVEFVTFSSWCNFGTYDIDFGWGKPIWATCMVPFAEDSDMGRFSTVILMDTREDKGVEAWVFLNKAAFNFMEKDTELLQYVSIDPSPVYS